MPLRYLPELLGLLAQNDAREREAFPEYDPRGRGEWYIMPGGPKKGVKQGGADWLWPHDYSSQMRMKAPRIYPDRSMEIDPGYVPLPMSPDMYRSLLQFFGRDL